MAKVLIHYDTNGDPKGLWRASGDKMESYYPDGNEKWAGRGKTIVNDRDPGRDTDDFFDHLTDHSSYFDHFGTTDDGGNAPLDSVYYKVKMDSVNGS